MRKNRLILAFLMGVLSVDGYGQTGPEILQQHLQAMGQEVWDQVYDVTIEGRAVTKDYKAYSINLYYKRADKIRLDGAYQGKKFIGVSTAENSWLIAPWESPEVRQDLSLYEQLLLNSSFIPGSPLANLQDEVVFEGLTDFEGTLYLTFVYEKPLEKGNLKRTFLLGRDNYHLYFEKYNWEENHALKIYEKYRNYSGLKVPTAVRFSTGEYEIELVYDELFIGMGISDLLFELPESHKSDR